MNSKANTHRIGIAIIFGIILLYMIPYFILSVGWFGDDGNIFNFALRNSRSSLTDIFLFHDNCMGRYRPLMQSLATVSICYLSFDSILIRVLSYAAFVTSIVTLFALVRAKTNNIWSPVIGAVFFALSPIKVQSLFRLGRPEIFVTAFCLLAIYSLHKALEANARKDHKLIILWNIGSLILAIIAVLWSEIGISVFVVMAIWILTSNRETSTHEHKYFLNDKLRMLALPAIGITLYLLWYISIHAPLSSGESDARYSIQLGWNLAQNTLSSLIGLTSPVAPVTAARIFYGAANVFDWISLVAGFAGIATICVTLFRGVEGGGWEVSGMVTNLSAPHLSFSQAQCSHYFHSSSSAMSLRCTSLRQRHSSGEASAYSRAMPLNGDLASEDLFSCALHASWLLRCYTHRQMHTFCFVKTLWCFNLYIMN